MGLITRLANRVSKEIDRMEKDATPSERDALRLIQYDEPFTSNTRITAAEKNHVWVSIAVQVLMRCVMRSEYVLKDNGVIQPTPFDGLFDKQGDNPPSTSLFMKLALWWWWEGEFFLTWDRGYRIPDRFIVLDPRSVYTRETDTGIEYYYLTKDHTYIRLLEGEFIHVMMPNIYNEHRGVFPLFSTGVSTLRQDYLINQANVDALQSGAVPDIVIKNKLRITEAQATEAVNRWNNAYNRNSGGSRVAVLGGGADVQQINQDLIKYIDLLDWDRTTILAMFGVPLKVANAETGKTALSGKDSNEQYRALFSQTVIPQLKYWSGEFNKQLFSRLGYPGITGNFDLSKVAELQEDSLKVSDQENKDIESGKLLINEVRKTHGLDPLPHGDIWWKPTNLEDINGGNNDSSKDVEP